MTTDKLAELAQQTADLYRGRAALDRRLDEMGGGYPSQGDGGHGGSADNGGPTLAAVIASVGEGRVDVARLERANFDREIDRAHHAIGAALRIYDRIVHPKMGVARLTDPGCELCAKVPCGCDRCNALAEKRHWCEKFGSVEVSEPAKRKGEKPTTRRVVLCASCYEFQRPDAAGRLPSHDEVLDHVEGRKRRWKVPASTRRTG